MKVAKMAQWSGPILIFNAPSDDGRIIRFGDGRFPWAKLPVPLNMRTYRDSTDDKPGLACVGTVDELSLGQPSNLIGDVENWSLHASGWLDLNAVVAGDPSGSVWDDLEDGHPVRVSAAIQGAEVEKRAQDEPMVFTGDWRLTEVMLGSRSVWPNIGIRLDSVHYRKDSPIPPEWIR